MQTGQKIKGLLVAWGPWVLLTLGSLWLIQGALAMTKGHGVIIRGAYYNAGTVKPGMLIHHSVRLINVSARQVDVSTEAGCGCTVVSVANKRIAPMHSAVIDVQVDTQGLSVGMKERAVVLHMQTSQKTWQREIIIQFRLQ